MYSVYNSTTFSYFVCFILQVRNVVRKHNNTMVTIGIMQFTRLFTMDEREILYSAFPERLEANVRRVT